MVNSGRQQIAAQQADLDQLRRNIVAAQTTIESREAALANVQERSSMLELKLGEIESEKTYLQRELETLKERLSRSMVCLSWGSRGLM